MSSICFEYDITCAVILDVEILTTSGAESDVHILTSINSVLPVDFVDIGDQLPFSTAVLTVGSH
jgi:hypothetical protein